jgi:hypothetical protein
MAKSIRGAALCRAVLGERFDVAQERCCKDREYALGYAMTFSLQE